MHMKPTVNLNGTSKAALIQYRLDAITALEAALEALREITPHGRDYPNREALLEAYPVYYSYRDRIQDVINDLTDEATYIDQQGD
jgi:hypothetical protein